MHIDINVATVVLIGLFGYLVGGIPVGWLLARAMHQGLDLRTVGTGKVGTSNIYRNVDAGLAAVVGPAQFVQGLAPVLVARSLGYPTWVLVLTALCAVVGNGWPVYLGFNGGRGIAVATGAVAGLNPLALAVLLVWYALGALFRDVALGVLAGFVLLPLVAAILFEHTLALGFGVLLVIVVMRRMEGIVDDMRAHRATRGVVLRRLLRDDRAASGEDPRHAPAGPERADRA